MRDEDPEEMLRRFPPCNLCVEPAIRGDRLCRTCRDLFDGDPPNHKLRPSSLARMKIPVRYVTATSSDMPEALASWDLEQYESVFLSGPVGTGKTHAACAFLKAHAFSTRELGLFANVAGLLDDLRSSYHGGKDPLPALIDTPLLVLDDLCVERATEWARERFYVLVNGRYSRLSPTIYTCNVGLDEVARLYGERAASRIAENCRVIRFEGPDRRLPRSLASSRAHHSGRRDV